MQKLYNIQQKLYNILQKIIDFLYEKGFGKPLLYLKQYFTIIAINLVAILIYCILLKIGKFEWSDFWAVFIPGIAGIPITISDKNKMSEKLQIMGLSIDYMLNKNGVTIDDILGVLISNKLKKGIIEPTRAFFDALSDLCDSGGYEQRRRIAEALPALYKLNKRSTKQLIEIKLRYDYDESRWQDDNRRRTIEAFYYFPKKENRYIKKHLSIQRRDSIYTVIAISEIIFLTDKFKLEERQQLLEDLNSKVQILEMEEDIKSFLIEVEKFVAGINKNTKNVVENYEYFKNYFKETNNLFMKIFISKNIIYISPNKKKCVADNDCKDIINCAYCILDFFDLCFNKDNDKNVRRPMAKEDIFHCLLCMLKYANYRDAARERILSLVKEEDTIIAITAFDYMHKLYEIDKELYNEILKYCLRASGDEPGTAELRKRAKHIKETLGMAIIK